MKIKILAMETMELSHTVSYIRHIFIEIERRPRLEGGVFKVALCTAELMLCHFDSVRVSGVEVSD